MNYGDLAGWYSSISKEERERRKQKQKKKNVATSEKRRKRGDYKKLKTLSHPHPTL